MASKTYITIPLSRVGEEFCDVADVFRQINRGTERYAITVKRYPSIVKPFDRTVR
jgi:hypothetical protein